MPVRRQMLDLNVELISDLSVGLRLMPGLDAGLGHGYRFSVIGRRPVSKM